MGGGRYDTSSAARGVALALLLVVAMPAVRAAAQQEPSPGPDSLRLELNRLQRRLDSLETVVSGLKQASTTEPSAGAGGDDDLAALRAAAAQAAGLTAEDTATATPENTRFSSHQRSLQATNPEISLTGDLFGQVDSKHAGRENFFPREFELSLVSSLDPYSRAKVFVSYHQPGGELVPFPTYAGPAEGAGVDVEEGYAEWVGLPGNLGIMVGKFRERFGTFNRWHSHALYFQSLPLPLQVFAGEEGIAQTGASVHWLLPSHAAGGTYELWLEPTVSSNERLFGDSNKPSVNGHFNAFWDLSPSTYFEVGTSAITGRHEGDAGDFRRTLWGAETTLDWRPPARSLYQELQLRGGVMVLSSGSGLASPRARSRAVGMWSMFDWLFAQNWHLSGRFDWAQNPDDVDQSAWLAGPALTWWQSEFVRLRGEYDLLGRPQDTPGKLLLQVTFAMGPHKHENY